VGRVGTADYNHAPLSYNLLRLIDDTTQLKVED
jgi:hypothetical protein